MKGKLYFWYELNGTLLPDAQKLYSDISELLMSAADFDFCLVHSSDYREHEVEATGKVFGVINRYMQGENLIETPARLKKIFTAAQIKHEITVSKLVFDYSDTFASCENLKANVDVLKIFEPTVDTIPF